MICHHQVGRYPGTEDAQLFRGSEDKMFKQALFGAI